MTIKQLLEKLSKVIVKEAPKVAEAPEAQSKFVTYINDTFSKQNIGKVAAKVAGAAMTANVTDNLIKDVPVANNIYTWYATTVDKFYENTVRKIPVVGDFLRKVTDTINKMVIPNAQHAIEKNRVNNPKFYEHLGMHTKFGIPLCYPDVVGVPFAGNKNFGSIGFITLRFNPLTSYNKIKARYTQLIDLLKGVRGLSGQMPYAEGDLYFYDMNTKYLITQYYTLKYALKLARIYSLEKNTLPTYLISKIGFDANDLIKNKASYIDLLGSMHEFIKQTVPNFGVLEERIQDLLYKLIPDSNDPKVALYYCIMLKINALIPNPNGNNYLVFSDFFFQESAATPSTTYLRLNYSHVAVDYNTYYNNWLNYSSKFPSMYKPFGSIRGDLLGCFGAAIFWSDKSIGDVETCKDTDMYHKFDELFLTQLQNGTILHVSGIDALPGNTVETTIVDRIDLEDIVIPVFNNDRVTDMIYPALNTDYAAINYRHTGFNPQGSAGLIVMPQSDGLIQASTLGHTVTESTAVIANKYSLSEGESHEILQLMSWFLDSSSGYSSADNSDSINMKYRTQTFFWDDFELLYYDVTGNANTSVFIRPTAMYLNGSGVTVYNAFRNILARCQFWSQADYGPKLPLTIARSDARDDYLLLDFNIMGSIDKKAFTVSVTNSAYSLYYADIQVDTSKTGKRIGNLIEAYKQQA